MMAVSLRLNFSAVMGSPLYGPISATKEDNWLKKSGLSVGLRASKGIRKSPGAFLGTFRDLSFITSSRRLGVKVGQFYERGEFVSWNDSKSDGIVNRIFVSPWHQFSDIGL